MAKKKKKVNKLIIGEFTFLLLIGILIGAVSQEYFNKSELVPIEISEEIIGAENIGIIKVPALNSDGTGVSTNLIVKAESGTGKTLVNIDDLLFWVDTQNSIRMAKLVSENITGLDLNKYDITFTIGANASLIGGESAGSALAIASIAALKNITLKEGVMITGTVNHDGSIGPIGGIIGKASAAKDIGINTLLVPLLQSKEVIYEEIEHCETFGFMEWCNTERIPKQIDISKESGLEVIEVGSVAEALEYFI